ncbi:MAG: hypothetical protein DME18_05210 [Verrucomicrobia bacterium]|nr:MAG: hypothetical protein DME18_05210 [Verrucomicrobiota bacterium]
MRLRLAHCFAVFLLPGIASGLGREVGKKAAGDWERSLVSVEINRKQYDYFQPWAKRVQTVTKAGLLIGPREILTTADGLDDRTLVRVQKGGRGQWSSAEVKWADYPANIAVVTSADEKFWAGLKPAGLADPVRKDEEIQIIRWRAGNLEVRKAEFSRFTVSHPNMSDAVHVQLELSSEIDGVGWSEVAIAGSKVVGLVFSQSGNQLQVLPSPFVRSILEARKKGHYKGLGYFDFTWQPAENPETLDYLKLEGEKRGVVVIDAPKKSGVEPVVRPRDVLLQVDGFDIDTQGDYLDPDYGHLLLENISTRNKWAGDPVRLKIWRDGRAQDVVYRLPKAEDAARLVPEAPFDQEPEYLIAGGLVFQPLTKNYLRSWGQDWERRAPFRLAYFRNQDPAPERPAIVILSQVLPDIFNLGYQESRQLVLEKVNGQKVNYLSDLQQALQKPANGFHTLELMKGDTLQRIVLDAATLEAATKRVLDRYGIGEEHVIISSAK